MATSEVEIVNSSLIKIGAEPITSLSDSNRNAIICNHQYEKSRDDLLRSHPWNFAIERAELSETLPVPIDGYGHKYLLPVDCLRVLLVNEDSTVEWAVEGRYLTTDETSVKIKYIKKVTDTTKFDKNFEETLAWRHAYDICYAITQNATLSKNCFDAFKDSLRTARSFDAQEGSGPEVDADLWLNARY